MIKKNILILIFVLLVIIVLFYFVGNYRIHFFLTLFIILICSVLYVKTKSYGEVALAFFIGVLTIFNIKWNIHLVLIFLLGYIVFSFSIFSISSFILHNQIELILTQAASNINEKKYKEIYNELLKLTKVSKLGQLSNLEKAKIIRYLAFVKVEKKSISQLLNGVETLFSATRINYIVLTKFLYDIHILSNVIISPQSEQKIGELFTLMRTLPIPPDEFIEVFNATKSYVLTGRMGIEKYLASLEIFIKKGLRAKDVTDDIFINDKSAGDIV